jgi:MoxR-like ATPase
LIRQYIVDIVGRTRSHPDIQLGVSPRGSLGVARCAQAHAAIHRREYVSPDDVKAMLLPVLAHRILLTPASRLRGNSPEDILQQIVEVAPVPGGPQQPA